MGIDIATALKAIAAIVVAVLGFVCWRSYKNSLKEQGRQKGIAEMKEVMDESFKELADDVLNGGHPYGVSESSIAEISSTRANPKSGVVTDSQREGGNDRPGRNGSATS
jgi:hypothetical protein